MKVTWAPGAFRVSYQYKYHLELVYDLSGIKARLSQNLRTLPDLGLARNPFVISPNRTNDIDPGEQ